MRWFLALLIFQVTAVAMVAPRWTPNSRSGEFEFSSLYAPQMTLAPQMPVVPQTTLAPQMPYTGYRPYMPMPYDPRFYGNYGLQNYYGNPAHYYGNQQYYGLPQYYGNQGYNFGIPPYFGYQQYGNYAQYPYAMGYGQQSMFNPTGPTWMDYMNAYNRSSGALPTPEPRFASNSAPRSHEDDCETCHASRRRPVASPIATGSAATAPHDDHRDDVTEAYHPGTSTGVSAMTNATATAQAAVDRVADSSADNSSATYHAAVPYKPQPQRAAGATRPAPKPAAQDDGADQKIPDARNATTPPNSQAVLHPRSSQERDSQKQPVWASFAEEFRACAPAGCEPFNYHAKSNRGGNSCHDNGTAIDVHAMICPGVYKGKNVMELETALSSRKFADMVRCVKERKKIKVLWQNKPYSKATVTSGHYDHAHFSIGCIVKGQRYW